MAIMNSNKLLGLFKVKEAISDKVIASNSAPLFDLNLDVFLTIPSYMAWCLRHDHSDGNIVIEGTISALSELGRSKYCNEGDARFKYECTSDQVAAVIEFLNWSLMLEPMLHEHTERAIKQWLKPINKSSKKDALKRASS